MSCEGVGRWEAAQPRTDVREGGGTGFWRGGMRCPVALYPHCWVESSRCGLGLHKYRWEICYLHRMHTGDGRFRVQNPAGAGCVPEPEPRGNFDRMPAKADPGIF